MDDSQNVTELLHLLADADVLVRRKAAMQLGMIFPISEAVILAFGTAINDKDSEVAQHAGIALFSCGDKSKLVVLDVIKALQHPDVCVRRVAAGILYMVGPDAKNAIPQLISLKGDNDECLRGWVDQALKSISRKEKREEKWDEGGKEKTKGEKEKGTA